MTRLEFFIKLRAGLQKLPPEELESAVRYYTEYFDDAGLENENKVLEELGDPIKIAQQIVAESMVREIAPYVPPVSGENQRAGAEYTYTPPKDTKKKTGFSAVWIAILAVFASPIALPIAIAIAAVALSLVIALASVFLALFCVAAALIISGVFCVGLGFCLFGIHLPTAVCAIGSGLLVAGLGLLFILPLIWLTRITFTGIARLISRPVVRRSAI